MPILRVARAHARVACAMAAQRAYALWVAMARTTRAIRKSRFVRSWASVGAKFLKVGESLPWTPDVDEPPYKIWRR